MRGLNRIAVMHAAAMAVALGYSPMLLPRRWAHDPDPQHDLHVLDWRRWKRFDDRRQLERAEREARRKAAEEAARPWIEAAEAKRASKAAHRLKSRPRD